MTEDVTDMCELLWLVGMQLSDIDYSCTVKVWSCRLDCNERHSDNWRNEVTFTFKMTIPTTCSLPVQRVNNIDWC